MSFPAYPEYKDSGVAWLGEVPRHWTIVRSRRLFLQVREPRQENDEQLSATQKMGVIPQELFMDQEGQKLCLALKGIENFKHVSVNDFVISLRSFQGGIEWSQYVGCVSPAYTVLRPTRNVTPAFWAYLFKSDSFISSLQSVTDGIRDGKNISYEQFGLLDIPLPSISEQSTIAAFLDHETDKIDALIAEQEKLIELLKEKRLAVISHAVTRGLDPTVTMKDSGVEWLGQVPEHWKVGQVKQIIKLATSGPRGWADLIVDEGALFFQSQNIGYLMDVVVENSQSITPPQNSESMRARLWADDVVVCITGGRTGAVAHIPQDIGEAYINQHVCLLRPNSSVCGRYLAYCLFSFGSQQQLVAAMYGLKQGLGLGQVQAVAVASPHLEEQIKIVDFLDHELAMFDGLFTESQNAITLLKERRSALISAAVTGKIDVRGYAPQQEAV